MAKRHLYEVDLMRAFIMMSVLSVHTTSFFNTMNVDMSAGFLTLGALISSLHYTREGFMFMTGLVLFVTYYRKEFHTLTFLKKRFLLIVVPYIAFNMIYIVFEGIDNPKFSWAPAALWHQLSTSLVTGNQFFLYYIVVSMQMYIVFPLLLYGLRKLERWHVQIFIASFLLQLGLMALNKFGLTHVNPASLPPVLSQLDQYRDRFILTYQFWFVAGGIMACHYDKILAFADKHVRALRVTLVIGLAVLWGHYFVDRLLLHESESLSELVLQPIMIPYSFIVTANMWYAGVQWSRRRHRAGWAFFSRFVQIAAGASFGIFLLQPFPLSYMADAILYLHTIGAPLWLHYSLMPFSILFVYLSGMVVAHYMGKVPILSYLVGQKASLRPRSSRSLSPTQTV
jgi:probable poly-beta-1,6-N-acetyl-D-glucosamine export protein